MNISLGRKELIVLLVILILFCAYFITDFFVNKKQSSSMVIEGFETMMNQRKLDELRKDNTEIFDKLKNINNIEKNLYENEVEIANRFLSKKFILEQVIGRVKLRMDGTKVYLGKSTKFVTMIDYRKQALIELVSKIDNLIAKLSEVNNSTNKSHKIYSEILNILTSTKELYEDKLGYFDETAIDKYVDFDNVLDSLKSVNSANTPSNSQTGTNPVNVTTAVDYTNTIRENLENSKIIYRRTMESIEESSNNILKFLNTSTDINKEVNSLLTELYNNKLIITRKMVVRDIGFNIIDTIVTLIIVGKLSKNADKEKTVATKKSNKIASELINLLVLENNTLSSIHEFFLTKKSSFAVEDNEFKYLNTVDANTNTLTNFCKKINKMNRPKNNSLLFKRLTREFIDKKNNQINTLNTNIDKIMNEMTIKDTYNQDLYSLRTNEEAEHQVAAIKKAKENIDNAGKFKINLK